MGTGTFVKTYSSSIQRLVPLIAIVASTAILPGCFLAPHYERPKMDMPPAFKESAPGGMSVSSAPFVVARPGDYMPRGRWWEMFGDPQLNQLEQKLPISNQSIKQAQAQYMGSRAIVSEVRSAYFPTITTDPSATRQRLSLTASGNPNGNSAGPVPVNIFNLPLTASWEPDFWGAVAFAVRTAKAEAQATAAQLQGVLLSMQAELAADYFSLEELDMETTLLNSAVDSYDKALQLTLARFNGGVASNADVAEARTQLETTRAQATDLGIARSQMEHAIAVLIGQTPSTFSLPVGQIRSVPPLIPIGLPSQLLERRPDIASAERLIVAANGQIGLARAAYFPDISLTATGGYESNTVTNWLTWPMRFWEIGASAAETLVDFGRRSAVSQEAHAAYDAQVAAYRQTVLAAFQEVEDNLTALRLLNREANQQDSATKAAEESLQLEIERYKAGIVSYLDVITTQNIALTNERTAVQILGRQMAAAVILIRATGGGWDISELPWPKNMYSPPQASTAPLTTVGMANPPTSELAVSSGSAASISYGALMKQLETIHQAAAQQAVAVSTSAPVLPALVPPLVPGATLPPSTTTPTTMSTPTVPSLPQNKP